MPKEYTDIKASLQKQHPDWDAKRIETSAAKIFASIYGTSPNKAEELAKEGKWEAWKKSHAKKSLDVDEVYEYFTDIELKENEGNFYVETYVSTPDLDLVNDVVPAETQKQIVAQLQTSAMANKVSLMHKRDSVPIGKVVESKMVNGRTWARVLLNKNHPEFKQIVKNIQDGFIDSSSIEYKATSFVNRLINNTMVRVITGIKILGFALTGRPANPAATITGFYCKSFDVIDVAEKAVWSTAFINNLPDSSFAYITKGGKKDKEGKTVPRSLRHLPYKDAKGKVDLPHLRNALARLNQTDISASAKVAVRKKLIAAGKKAGIKVMDKKSLDKVIILEDVELKEEDVIVDTDADTTPKPEAKPKEDTTPNQPEVPKAEDKPAEPVKAEPETPAEKPAETQMPVVPKDEATLNDPKMLEELKKKVDNLEAEKRVLVAKTEKFEQQAQERAITEMEEYKKNPSLEKAKELLSKTEQNFKY